MNSPDEAEEAAGAGTARSGGAESATPEREWLVLHVKPRTEKKVMAHLARTKGFHYLPTYVKTTRVQRRKVKRVMPLFPGYVFTHLSPDERLAILRSNLIVDMIRDPFPRLTIHQLRQVARVARAAPAIVNVLEIYKVGTPVRVKYGPLAGTIGFVKRAGAQATLCINVDILGTAVEVFVSPDDLEPPEKK